MNNRCTRPAALLIASMFLLVAPDTGFSFASDMPLVVPVFQQRAAGANAWADNGMTEDGDIDHQEASDYGPFIAEADAGAWTSGAQAGGVASQDSTIDSDGIKASGDSGYYLFVAVGDAFVEVASQLKVTFNLTRSSDYTLQGSLQASPWGYVGFVLKGPQGIIDGQSMDDGAAVVDESGTLAAGSYTLEILSYGGDGFGGGFYETSGSSAFDLELRFVSGATPSGAVPDGGDVPGDPLRVERLPGAFVRLTWGASCRATDDDYAIYEGPLGDPLGLFPVTCSTAGQPSYDFAPTHGAAAFLVVPTNGEAEGSYGKTSSGVERPPSPGACQPQVLGQPICP